MYIHIYAYTESIRREVGSERAGNEFLTPHSELAEQQLADRYRHWVMTSVILVDLWGGGGGGGAALTPPLKPSVALTAPPVH